MATRINEDGHITGTLEGTDYGDNVDREVDAGEYTYSLTADGRGKLAFRVEARELNENGGGARWVTVHEKQKIQGITANGRFDAPALVGDEAQLRFNFNREFMARSVDYDLRWEPA